MNKVATIAILLLTFSAVAFAQQATPEQTEEWLKMCLAAGGAGCPSTPKQTVEVTPPARSANSRSEDCAVALNAVGRRANLAA
jgi:hypothetical protein